MRASPIWFGALASIVSLAATAGGCSLAGLDEYLSGSSTTGAGGGGSGTTGTEGGGGSSCSGLICGDACVDSSTDASNCGACGKTCASGYGCAGGVCGNVPLEVTAGGLRTCVVLHGGEVWCWGRNNWGQSGIMPGAMGTISTAFLSSNCVPAPTRISGLTDAVQVVTAGAATCARTRTGKVWCWGRNHDGALGHAPGTMGDKTCTRMGLDGADDTPTLMEGPCSPDPIEVPLPAGVSAAQLSAGARLVCLRSTAGAVYCWGRNHNGEVQAPASEEPIVTPTKNANASTDAADLSVGYATGDRATVCVARTGTNRVDCWGSAADSGSVAGIFPSVSMAGCVQGTSCDPVAHPVPLDFTNLTGNVTADSIHPGYVTACALRNQAVQCWGNNLFALKGDGTVANSHFDPGQVPGLPAIATLSMQFTTAAALDTTGSLWTWGYNGEGQIGDTTLGGAPCNVAGTSCVTKPKTISTSIAFVSMGSSHAAAITRDGKVLTWGSSFTHELGHQPGTMGDVACGMNQCNPSPQPVMGLP